MVVWIRDSLSQGSLASMRSVSSTIPKNSRTVDGPTTLSKASGMPSTAHSSTSRLKLR